LPFVFLFIAYRAATS